MKKQFNEYMETEAPIQLKVLFHEMNDTQAIMLQECFHAFARKIVSELQSKDGKLPIPDVVGRSEQLKAFITFAEYAKEEYGLHIPLSLMKEYVKSL